jgi:3-mercaptopyruvate sulfurtransferase SseA
VRNFDDISRNLESKREQVVDVRASEEFHKTLADDKRPNQIPNSINLPYYEFFDKQTGTLKSAEELKQCKLSNFYDMRASFIIK